MPASAPVHSWERTNNPWERLHIDYLGPFMGKMFLVIVDSYSKWVEVFPVSNSTSQTTTDCSTLFRMDIFGAAHGWGYVKRPPP